ncbi:N-acetylmuramoyl-L-alanine amidase [Jeotgalibacillus proteolyticus]|uniref:N-acetylmuramoyl-L-alanine amidase n=1 Tax=Jeotgalibacillus proteolyticus TaxID=2082395 RepID=A0A2S5GAZ6_9BACL|nr:N-acetylmuramoyl-L-alanine amidase [Jeotgalibacillus proteolyticus]PPA70207.1 N-acetylmuramoyl-L-alanine amidase [Jeotgalibacillus proteolyticus]
MTLIAIDAGHGYETPGKRSPDGMREYAFNRAVAAECIKQLEKASLKTLKTHHDTIDVSLKNRTDKANQAGADFFISIHANAFGNGGWNEVSGIETYIHSTKGNNALTLAKQIQTSLIQGTGRKDRGVKKENFHVLRESSMPAVLIECGFMTNREEKALLASTDYRVKCGELIAGAIISYFKGSEATSASKKTGNALYRVQAGAFSTQAGAAVLAAKLKKAGFDAFITESK